MRPVFPLLLAFSFSGILGCGDDGTSNDTDDVPIGMTISESGRVLVTVELTIVQGSISVEPGEASRTLTVEFLNLKGSVVSPEGRYLEVEISDPALATWEPSTPGALAGRFLGAAEGGTTSAVFTLYEGALGSGDPVYASPAITIRVEGQV